MPVFQDILGKPAPECQNILDVDAATDDGDGSGDNTDDGDGSGDNTDDGDGSGDNTDNGDGSGDNTDQHR